MWNSGDADSLLEGTSSDIFIAQIASESLRKWILPSKL